MAQYINKDALVAEIERLRKEDGNPYFPSETADKYYARGVHFTCDGLVNFLNTLEVKEVDLEEKLDAEWNKCNPVDEGMGCEFATIGIEQFYCIAKYFFELGLKVQKGE